MHEMAITRSVLSIALDEAKKHNARAVRSVELLIGEYSGAIPACVEEYFNILSRGTIAEHARLVIKRQPARVSCADCGYDGETKPVYALCPACGGEHIRIVSGTQFCVNSLEVE